MKRNLDGYGKRFKGYYNDEPTEKQKNIIKKLQLYYGINNIPACETKGEAWHLINKYQDVVKYDREKNEFYIEEKLVNNKTCYKLISEEEYECVKIIKEVREKLEGEALEEYNKLIDYLGDYELIKEVSECIINQYNNTSTQCVNPINDLQKKLIKGIITYYNLDENTIKLNNEQEAREFIQKHNSEIYFSTIGEYHKSYLVIGLEKNRTVKILHVTSGLRKFVNGVYEDISDELYKELGKSHDELTYLRCLYNKIYK